MVVTVTVLDKKKGKGKVGPKIMNIANVVLLLLQLLK
jgi:hypothetical protein